jgi:hypothetical protein
MSRADAALHVFLTALDTLLAAHGEAMRERSTVTLTRRPGLLTLSEADGDVGARPILTISADLRDPATFGQRIDIA